MTRSAIVLWLALAIGGSALGQTPAAAPEVAAAASVSGSASDAPAEAKKPGDGAWLVGLATAISGCLLGVAPVTGAFFCSPLCCGWVALPCSIVSIGGGAALGAAFASGFDGGRILFAGLWGGGLGLGIGIVTAVGGIIVALATSGVANQVNRAANPGDLTDPRTIQNGMITGAVGALVGGSIMLLGAIGSAVGIAIAYGFSGDADEAPAKPVPAVDGPQPAPLPTPTPAPPLPESAPREPVKPFDY